MTPLDQSERQGTCGATKRSGGPCTRPAGWGTSHAGTGACKLHSGSTPNGIKAAAKQQAAKAVAVYGLPVEVDPHTALLDELHRTAGHVAWLGDLISSGRMTAEQNPTSRVRKVRLDQGTLAGDIPLVWVSLYREERLHLARVAKTCIDVGIEERRVRVAEQTGQLLAGVIRGVLTDLGVADHPEAPAIVRRHLMLVGGQQGS